MSRQEPPVTVADDAVATEEQDLPIADYDKQTAADIAAYEAAERDRRRKASPRE